MSREAVIVTGASMGIGLGIAERLVGDGHRVINLDVAEPVRDVGAQWEPLDFRDAARTQAVLARVCAANAVLQSIEVAMGTIKRKMTEKYQIEF